MDGKRENLEKQSSVLSNSYLSFLSINENYI